MFTHYSVICIQARFEMFIDEDEGEKKYGPLKFLSVKKKIQFGKVIKLHGLLGHIILTLNLIQKMRRKANRNVIKSNLAKEKSQGRLSRLGEEFHGG